MTICQYLLRLCFFITLGLLLPAVGFSSGSPERSPIDRGYAPPDTCVQCHQDQAEAWRHSDHAWAMKPASRHSVLGNFDDTVFDDDAVRAEFSQRDDRFWVTIEGENGVEDFPVAYTFGHHPLQQYLVELSRGRLQALTIAWDSRPREDGGQRWFSLYPGQAFAPDDALHWTGRYQNWNAMCADCHSTFLSMNYKAESDSFATTWQEQNVGCQGCHGPGGEHVQWAETYDPNAEHPPGAEDSGLTLSFEGMASDKLVETCAYCHSRRLSLKDGHHAHEAYLDKALPATLRPDLYHPDGQIQGEVYVYGSFVQSKMFKAGVTCLDCHGAHTTKLVAQGNGLCTQCHNETPPDRFPALEGGNYDVTEHHRHPTGSPGAQCVNCHMPEKTYMVVDPRRDHSFRIPRPDLTLSTGSPNVCTNCHEGESAEWAQNTVDKWYPSSDRPSHFGEALSAFRQAENNAFIRLATLIRNKSEPAIARATAAEHMGSFGGQGIYALRSGLLADEPLVQAYAAGAFSQSLIDDSQKQLASLLTQQHPRAVRDQALKSLAGVDLNKFPEKQRSEIQALRTDYEQRLEGLATLPGSRFSLANYLHRSGRFAEALQHYQGALDMDPAFAPARVNLATLASERNQPDLAIRTLTEGAELDTAPYTDRSHLAYLLALVLVEQGQPEQALPRFTQASKLDPSNTRAAYNHSLVLARMNRWQDAEQVLANALEQHPEDYDLLNARLSIYLEQGRYREALKHAKTMQSVFPQDANLGQLIRALKARGDDE